MTGTAVSPDAIAPSPGAAAPGHDGPLEFEIVPRQGLLIVAAAMVPTLIGFTVARYDTSEATGH